MSVAAIGVLPESWPTGIKGHFVRTRRSDLAVLKSASPTATACLTLISVKSIGWGKSWTEVLTVKDFVKHANVSSDRPVTDALQDYEDAGMIERKKMGHGYVYRRRQPIDYDGREVLGNCPECKKVTGFSLDRDVTIPHSLFLQVQQAVDHGSLMCILLIALETFFWKEGEIWIKPAKIKIEDFERLTGKKRSEVEEDLRQAERRGLIGSMGRRGEIQTFWPIPNAWPMAPIRARKTGGNSAPSKRTQGESKTVENSQQTEATKASSPVEFWSRPCGRCHECEYFGPVDIIPEMEKPPKKPLQRAREGPPEQIRSTIPEFTGFKQA